MYSTIGIFKKLGSFSLLYKMPKTKTENNLKEERFITGHSFRGIILWSLDLITVGLW
jgi:hypothetical protein